MLLVACLFASCGGKTKTMLRLSPVAEPINAPQYLCLHHLLEAQAERSLDALAILAPGRTPLTYSRLRTHVDAVGQTLHALGIGRHSRVAMVLPNGPEMAVAFLATAAHAICAPLNPAYRAQEFAFYLDDLQATALLIQAGMTSPARSVAQARGIPVLEACPSPMGEAGLFTLAGGARVSSTPIEQAQPNEVALLLHTSGTTSRPKLVPLTHANLCTSAHNIAASLALETHDRCLNVMPLFHIHGLIGALLSSLIAGASVVCTPGFYAPQFFAWMDTFHPTWYTAVPTMHQAIVARAAYYYETITRCPLRFIRSCSASLPAGVLMELEQVFHAPVIDAYGMTEAAHQIASNPLPPRPRKTGSVGLGTGPEMAITDEVGYFLPPGKRGEVVVRGANVTPGYVDNPGANAESFVQGWFRTGDQGYVDADGYLFLTGRLKELINRGGEKIAPREIDDVLLQHTAVAQAVTFAVPHPQLGEEIAAAVVLHQRGSTTAREIRDFAATRLADFKVPSQVVLVDEIPQGPTGKLQRIGLAEKLGITASNQNHREGRQTKAGFVAPHTPVERELAQLWAQVLGLEQPVGIYDNFFELGGDSVLATQLISRVRDAMQVQLSLLSLFDEASTVAGMAESVRVARRAEVKLHLPPIERVSRNGSYRFHSPKGGCGSWIN
jgi:acyl-CoA synthetase (AMP-forming)/AMP-acid ligase II